MYMNYKILVREWQHLKILPTLTKLLNRPRPSITIQLFYMTTFHSRIPQIQIITEKHAFNFDIISYPFNIHRQKQSNTPNYYSENILKMCKCICPGMCSIYIVYLCFVMCVCIYVFCIFFRASHDLHYFQIPPIEEDTSDVHNFIHPTTHWHIEKF